MKCSVHRWCAAGQTRAGCFSARTQTQKCILVPTYTCAHTNTLTGVLLHRLARENAGLQQLLEYMECCGCFGDGLSEGSLDVPEALGGGFDVQQDLLGPCSLLIQQDDVVKQQQQQQQPYMHKAAPGPGTSGPQEGPTHLHQEQQEQLQAAAAAPCSSNSQEDLETLSQIWSQA
eukprot:scaffold8752_cov18-Tisochrysis_lutea.AAC.1